MYSDNLWIKLKAKPANEMYSIHRRRPWAIEEGVLFKDSVLQQELHF